MRAAPGFWSQGRRKGGGLNPSSRELEEMGLNGCWVEDFTKVLDHLSPEAGGILYMMSIHFYIMSIRFLCNSYEFLTCFHDVSGSKN